MLPEYERDKAQAALDRLPPLLRHLFDVQFQLIGSRPGSYVGLVCLLCGHWAHGRHDDDCPLKGLRVTTDGRIIGTELDLDEED